MTQGAEETPGLESSSQSAPGMFSYIRRETVASGPACYDNVFGITGRWKNQNKFFKWNKDISVPKRRL